MTHPFEMQGNTPVDSNGRECHLYPDVHVILSLLKQHNVQIGLASRVRNIAGAFLLLHLFNIRDFFWPIEIYPTSKVLHFEQIKKKTGLDFDDMLFCDDDKRNLRDLLKLGLPCFHVAKGLNIVEFVDVINGDSLLFKG